MSLSAAASTLSVSTGSATRAGVLSLYREFMRNTKEIVRMYDLEVTRPTVIAAVKKQFLDHGHVEDPKVVDMLVVKGTLELNETMLKWKGKSHIMGYVDELTPPREKSFLERFFEGN